MHEHALIAFTRDDGGLTGIVSEQQIFTTGQPQSPFAGIGTVTVLTMFDEERADRFLKINLGTGSRFVCGRWCCAGRPGAQRECTDQ
jgi:hypothetical protein